MPEGDSIFRAARTLHRALAGAMVTRFVSVFPHLTRVDADAPLRGRLVDRVEARGKHLLIWFSGDLVLRTHMRMNGSWHIYRPGERWQRPRHDMRIVIETDAIHAVAFSVPVAEFVPGADLDRVTPLQQLGPDPLSQAFDAEEAVRRLHARGDVAIADALLDQTAIAGIGNIFKSEVLFLGKINPFVPARELSSEALVRVVTIAQRVMRANVTDSSNGGIATYAGLRRTSGRADPSPRLWVYGRAGKPCRKCGTPISRQRHGPHARSTYWCERCQAEPRPQASGPRPQ